MVGRFSDLLVSLTSFFIIFPLYVIHCSRFIRIGSNKDVNVKSCRNDNQVIRNRLLVKSI